jgi:hypothetical protein
VLAHLCLRRCLASDIVRVQAVWLRGLGGQENVGVLPFSKIGVDTPSFNCGREFPAKGSVNLK